MAGIKDKAKQIWEALTLPDGIDEEYTVVKGDTLWDICDFYFRDPRQWPRIWALNPHVTNPH